MSELKTNNLPIPSPQEVENMTAVCKILGGAPYYQKMGACGVFAILMTARELGLPPMTCLNGGLYVVNGRVALSSQMIHSMILEAGHKVDIKELSEDRCILQFKRKDENKVNTHEYTFQEAEKAKLTGKDNWRFYRKDMLFNRCMASGARKYMPDTLRGCYSQEEMEDKTKNEDLELKFNTDIPQEKPFEEPKPLEISFEKSEGYDDFVKKYGIFEDSEKNTFIDHVLKGTKKSKEEVVNQACVNEEVFLKTFEEWKSKQK